MTTVSNPGGISDEYHIAPLSQVPRGCNKKHLSNGFIYSGTFPLWTHGVKSLFHRSDVADTSKCYISNVISH